MASVLEHEETELKAYRSSSLPKEEPVSLALPSDVAIETTEIGLTFLAMRDDVTLASIPLVLSVRLSVGGVDHFWSDGKRALSATLVRDRSSSRLDLTLKFTPVGKSARAVAEDARWLNAVGSATHLSLMLPDGDRLPDPIPVPRGLAVDDNMLRLIDLFSTVSYLARTDITIPEEVSDGLLSDLLTARRLLSGETVRGRWSAGEVQLTQADLPTLRKVYASGGRRDLYHVAPMTLQINGVDVRLGEVAQHFADAMVDELVTSGDSATVHLRAYGGTSATTLTPTSTPSLEIDPHVILSAEAFAEVLSDLDAPPRRTRLKGML